jgi:hypothetical protein
LHWSGQIRNRGHHLSWNYRNRTMWCMVGRLALCPPCTLVILGHLYKVCSAHPNQTDEESWKKNQRRKWLGKALEKRTLRGPLLQTVPHVRSEHAITGLEQSTCPMYNVRTMKREAEKEEIGDANVNRFLNDKNLLHHFFVLPA